MKIIDAHAHIYPPKIAEKATLAIGDFYELKMEIDSGTAEKLISVGKEANISEFIVHSCATKPSQVRPINEFIKYEMTLHKEFIGFMTLHTDLSEEEILNEIKWGVENGFKGIKLHPDFQKFDIDGSDAEKIYRSLMKVERVFPILFHTGDNRYTYSRPEKLARIARKYPSLTFIGAHFGGYRCWDDEEVYKGLDNVYFDTSSSLAFISKEKAERLIANYGENKFFFGTDFPMWDAKEELERFLQLNLTDIQKEKILYGNIEKLLNIKL